MLGSISPNACVEMFTILRGTKPTYEHRKETKDVLRHGEGTGDVVRLDIASDRAGEGHGGRNEGFRIGETTPFVAANGGASRDVSFDEGGGRAERPHRVGGVSEGAVGEVTPFEAVRDSVEGEREEGNEEETERKRGGEGGGEVRRGAEGARREEEV
jgi:hypothetical protein